MAKVYLSNAFSLQMQGENECITTKINIEEAKGAILDITKDSEVKMNAESCVGHSDIAAVMSERIGISIPTNRVSISLKDGDILIVGQYVGPRLPEGCKKLPEGASIQWYRVEVFSSVMEVLNERRNFLEIEQGRPVR